MPMLDDRTRYSEIAFLKEKSEAPKFLIAFCERIHTKTGRYPRAIRTDNGGEFKNSVWTAYCESKGIIHQTTAAYSPESNGVIERYNQTLASICPPALEDLPSSL